MIKMPLPIRLTLALGLTVVAGLLAFPPWVFTRTFPGEAVTYLPGPHAFLFDPPFAGPDSGVQLHWGRISLELAVVLVMTIAIVLLLSWRIQPGKPRSLASNAVDSITQSALLGDPASQFELFRRTFKSYPTIGRQWCRVAAEKGHTLAQVNLGLLLDLEAAPGQQEEADLWYRRAAEGGDTTAQAIVQDTSGVARQLLCEAVRQEGPYAGTAPDSAMWRAPSERD